MSAGLANSDQLYRLARSDRAEDRETLAKSLTTLLHKNLSEGETFLVQDILLRLLREAESDLRRSMAMHLSGEAKCPQALIDFLVFECSLSESEHFLKNSPAMNDNFLIDVGMRFEKPRYWRAIAARPQIGADLALYLVRTNDEEVHHILVKSPKVHLVPEAMEILTESAVKLRFLQAPLLERVEITEELARRLYWHTSEALKQEILRRFNIDKAMLDKLADQLVLRPVIRRRAHVKSIPMEMLGLVRRIPKITTRQIMDSMQKADPALFCCLCGTYLKVNPEIILEHIEAEPVQTLAALCRAIYLNRSDFNNLYLQWRRQQSGSTVTNAAQLMQALETFDKMKPEQVRQVMQSWEAE